MDEAKNKYYGIWSCVSHKFVFGIKEPTKNGAWKALSRKIGKDTYKCRWECKAIYGHWLKDLGIMED
jgi:hypothetical protein